jgi:hypothetical protein
MDGVTEPIPGLFIPSGQLDTPDQFEPKKLNLLPLIQSHGQIRQTIGTQTFVVNGIMGPDPIKANKLVNFIHDPPGVYAALFVEDQNPNNKFKGMFTPSQQTNDLLPATFKAFDQNQSIRKDTHGQITFLNSLSSVSGFLQLTSQGLSFITYPKDSYKGLQLAHNYNYILKVIFLNIF